MEQTYKVRHRVKFSVTSKGVVSPEVSVEMIDNDKIKVLTEAKELLVLAQAIAREKSI